MRLLTIVLLVCLLVAGTVSAVAINPASVGAAKTIVPVSTQAPVTRTAVSALPDIIVTKTPAALHGYGMIMISSVPSGADIYLNRNRVFIGKTPSIYNIFGGGTSNITFALDGYAPYTETVSVGVGETRIINATLKRQFSPSLALATTKAGDTRNPATTTTIIQIPGALTPVTISPVLVTTTPTIDMVCPNADWSCLTDAEAVQQFGYPNARYGDGSCGYERVNNAFVFKYCYMDVPSGGSLPPGALAATGIRDGGDIYIMNDTWIEHAVVNKTPAVSNNGDVFQPVYNFFSSIFNGKLPTPEDRLKIVSLNPCPEPPAEVPLVGRVK
jgi:hypothetical protein